jgi:cell shape-determining protein MreC
MDNALQEVQILVGTLESHVKLFHDSLLHSFNDRIKEINEKLKPILESQKQLAEEYQRLAAAEEAVKTTEPRAEEVVVPEIIG